MTTSTYRRPRVIVLEPGESLEIRFASGTPPMVIHFEDGERANRIDKQLAATRSPTLTDELLRVRKLKD